jgi:hypothetical protein
MPCDALHHDILFGAKHVTDILKNKVDGSSYFGFSYLHVDIYLHD